MGIWLRDPPFAPSIAFGRHDRQKHNVWPKSLPKNAGFKTAKQHGLASSRTPFFDLCWGDLQCQTLRPEPIKNGDLASRSTVCTFNCVWASRPAKPRLLTQKPSRKGCLRNRETAWPGELNDTVFRPALEWSSMSNVASRTYKKENFLQLWGSICTSKWLRTTPLAPSVVWASRRAKPRLLTQKPSQKGCLRNRETAWPGELKDTVFWPVLGWSSVSNVASRTYKN